MHIQGVNNGPDGAFKANCMYRVDTELYEHFQPEKMSSARSTCERGGGVYKKGKKGAILHGADNIVFIWRPASCHKVFIRVARR